MMPTLPITPPAGQKSPCRLESRRSHSVACNLPVRSARLLKKTQLFVLPRYRVCALAPTAVLAANSMLHSQPRHQLRNPLAVARRQKRPRFVALPIALHQLGKFFFQERQEDVRRTWLQEQRVGENVLAASFRRGPHHLVQITRRIGD